MLDFKSIKHIHFVGLGGSGMSVLAEAFLANGYIVTGSDMKTGNRVDDLINQGIKISVPHSTEYMHGADLLCYSTAIPKTNCERQMAKTNKIPEVCRGELLAYFLSSKKVFAVAGSHGKTTTSAYLANVLNSLEQRCGLFIGGLMQDGKSFEWQHDSFVVETDESDGTFLNYSPKYAIITNVDREHLGFYGSFENLVAAFKEFYLKIESFPVVCGDDKVLNQIAYETKRSHLSYGLEAHNDLWANHIDCENDGTSYDVIFKSSYLGRIKIPLLGDHNVKNSLAIVSLATLLGYEFNDIKKAMLNFTGVKRRMETKGEVNDIVFVDDYAHHPTEIIATLSAAKRFCKDNGKRLVAICEPHRHSRVQECYDEFTFSFRLLDSLIITDIYGAAEQGVAEIDIKQLCEDIAKNSSVDVTYLTNSQLCSGVLDCIASGDYVLGMGAGNMSKILEEMVENYREYYD